MNLVLAVNNEEIVEAIKGCGRYNVIGAYKNRRELYDGLNNAFLQPDALLCIEGFDSQTDIIYDMLINIKRTYPRIRIIYILGSEFTTGVKKMIGRMVENEIYDIGMANEIDLNDICELIDNPKDYSEASQILESNGPEVYDNLFTFSSIKPGTGKTFLATNVALAIAKYGQPQRLKSGKLTAPRVLILDGDLLNLGVGTTLRTDNYDRNMLTALQKIEKIVDENGNYEESRVEEVKAYCRSCLMQYRGCENLFIMSANSIPLSELAKISPSHFYFLIQMLVKAFNVIIVDSNSAFDHQTTAVLYELSRRIYFMVDNDYNNIQNNLRYVRKLKEMGYDDKINFIVNKDLTREAMLSCLEDLEYNTNSIGDLVIDYRVPLVDAGIMKSIDYGENILMTSPNPAVQDARKRIIDIADGIWKIDDSKIEVPQEEPKKQNKLISLLNK